MDESAQIIKSSRRKDGITKMDKRLMTMIQECTILLAQQGYNYEANAVLVDQRGCECGG